MVVQNSEFYGREKPSQHLPRLQNSPYFWVFKYARAVKQKVWNEAENRERDWGETPKNFFSPASHALRACEARVRLLRHALPISLLILRKKPTVLQSSIYLDPSQAPANFGLDAV